MKLQLQLSNNKNVTVQLLKRNKIMTHNIYIYILIMGGISYLIRVLPMTLIRKPLKNQFLQSFLYYVPYVTLAVMTFPAILHATQSPISGVLALVVGVVTAWCGAGLLPVAVLCCVVVFIAELFL
jgi:branched-subunit amino acid transport protein